MASEVPSWEDVARNYGRFLYNVAYRLAGKEDDAHDLVTRYRYDRNDVLAVVEP